MTGATPPKAVHPDAALLVAWQERASLWHAKNAAYQDADQRGITGRKMDEITQRFWDEEDVPEGRIMNTRALTPEGLAVKLRLLALFTLEDKDIEVAIFDDGPIPEEAGDDGDVRYQLLWSILRDAERMAKPRRLRPLVSGGGGERLAAALQTLPVEALRGISACLEASVALSEARRDYWSVMQENGYDRLPSSVRELLEGDEHAAPLIAAWQSLEAAAVAYAGKEV